MKIKDSKIQTPIKILSPNKKQTENVYEKKIEFEKIRKHIKKASAHDSFINELDDTISDEVEITKNIFNSRDFIPKSDSIHLSNYNNKSKKRLVYNYDNNGENLNALKFLYKNGLSFSPKNNIPLLKQIEKEI